MGCCCFKAKKIPPVEVPLIEIPPVEGSSVECYRPHLKHRTDFSNNCIKILDKSGNILYINDGTDKKLLASDKEYITLINETYWDFQLWRRTNILSLTPYYFTHDADSNNVEYYRDYEIEGYVAVNSKPFCTQPRMSKN